MRCEFCGKSLENAEDLQLHQVASCPAVLQEDYVRPPPETANVMFKWLVDRVISEPVIHLIGSDMNNNIELTKGNGSYRSSEISMVTGTYKGQLVISETVIPVIDFSIDELSDTIYLVAESGSLSEDLSQSPTQQLSRRTSDLSGSENNMSSPQQLAGRQLENLILSSRSASLNGSSQRSTPRKSNLGSQRSSQGESPRDDISINADISPGLSDLHKELIQHQISHPNENLSNILDNIETNSNASNLLSEINFASATEEMSVRPRKNTSDVLSPEAHTLQHVDDLTADQSLTREHYAQEHQQPVESEAEEGFADHNIVSTTSNHSGHSVNEILSELTLANNKRVHTPSRQHSSPIETEQFEQQRVLPRLPSESLLLPSEPSFHSNTASDAIQNKIEEAMRDIEPIVVVNRRDNRESGTEGMYSGGSGADGVHGGGSGYASDESSDPAQRLANRNSVDERIHSRESSARLSERRTRTRSNSSHHSETAQHIEGSKDNVISELKIKCASCESELERLNKEVSRLNDLTENYKEVKVELETKCRSYEEELQNISQKSETYKEHAEKKKNDYVQLIRQIQSEKEELEVKCASCDEEMTRVNRLYEDLLEKNGLSNTIVANNAKNERDKELISELEARCQSYDTEIEKLKKENKNLFRKYQADDSQRSLRDLKIKCKNLENEKQKLIEESQSVEAAQTIHENDIKNERERLETMIKLLKKENMELKSMSRVKSLPLSYTKNESSSQMDPEYARNNIDKLKTENKNLKNKLRTIRKEVHEVAPSNEDSTQECSSSTYQPQILSPRRSMRYSDIMQSNYMTNRLDHFSSEDVDGVVSRVLPSRYNPGNYASTRDENDVDSYHAPSGDLFNGRVNHTSTDDSYNVADSALNDILKRYSPRHSEVKRHSPGNSDARQYSSRDVSSYTSKVYASTERSSPVEVRKKSDKTYRRSSGNFDPDPRFYRQDVDTFRSTEISDWSKSNRYHPKSRSLDRGLENVGQSEDTYTSHHARHTSMTRIPFCPTTANDLKVGMKVSVNRTTGGLSRGIVKWIGTLPHCSGDYIGIELESESGKHNGFLDGVQYFRCKPDRGVFVKFPKVIMAWK